MKLNRSTPLVLVAALGFAVLAFADDDPRHVRHELMEGVRDAAKPLGEMLKGERDFDAGMVTTSLASFDDAGQRFGNLFPPGSETGEGTEAAPAIWADRDGFDAALAQWQEATAAAIAAGPETLDAAKPVLGRVFNACKNCHDNYRLEDE